VVSIESRKNEAKIKRPIKIILVIKTGEVRFMRKNNNNRQTKNTANLPKIFLWLE